MEGGTPLGNRRRLGDLAIGRSRPRARATGVGHASYLFLSEVHHARRLPFGLAVQHDIDALAPRKSHDVVGVSEVQADDRHLALLFGMAVQVRKTSGFSGTDRATLSGKGRERKKHTGGFCERDG